MAKEISGQNKSFVQLMQGLHEHICEMQKDGTISAGQYWADILEQVAWRVQDRDAMPFENTLRSDTIDLDIDELMNVGGQALARYHNDVTSPASPNRSTTKGSNRSSRSKSVRRRI